LAADNSSRIAFTISELYNSKLQPNFADLITFPRMNLFVKIELNEWLNNTFKPAENYSMESRQKNLI
jgi:hypothetical protein